MLWGRASNPTIPHQGAEWGYGTGQETDARLSANVSCPASMCAFNEAVNYRQDVSIVQLRYNRFWGAWLNEAKVDYSRFRRNPSPNNPGLPAPGYSDSVSGNNTNNYAATNLSPHTFIQHHPPLP